MGKRRGAPRKRSQVGPRIVRAWFDTVINPLLSYLEREQKLVARKNWTWRFRPGALEAIREVNAYVGPEARPNLEQFNMLYPDVKRGEEEHDKKVSALRDKCRGLYKTLGTSELLGDLFRRVTSPEALASLGREVTVKDLFGAYPESDYLDLLGEYIINSTGELPNYYTTAPLWNKHKDEFLAMLDRPAIRRRYQETVSAGNALFSATDRLVGLLKEHRLRLSLEHDVPFVATGTESAEP
ncbi:MAG: hypothetical protein ACE5JD_00465 [Candidatus Methylomirabilia bacterium]